MIEENLKKTWEEVYFSDNCHEKDIIEKLPNMIADCEVFMDIGASGGQYTFFANKILQNKLIVAVEADPIRFKLLNESCKKWQNENNNKILTYHNALYEKDNDVIDFLVTQSNVSGALFMNDHINNHIQNTTLEKKEVKTLSLLTLLSPYKDKIIFAKIDVEGAELVAFKSVYEKLKDYNVTFLIEIHPWKDSNANLFPWQIFSFFKKSGFVPSFYKDHFIVRKSKSTFRIQLVNLYYAFIFRLRFLVNLIKK